MRVRLERIQEGQEEEALLRIAGEDASTQRLKEYIETESFRVISIAVRDGEESLNVESADIYYIESVQEVQRIHTAGHIFETRQRLYMLEKILPDSFARISRSVIVNLEKIRRYKPIMNGLMEVLLDNGESVYISRRYLREIRERILDGGF